MLTAGAHVPVIAGRLVEDKGNTGAAANWQTFGMAAKVGVICGSTVMLKVVVVAHCPAVGVKVDNVVPATEVLTAGAQVPVIAGRLVEDKGKTGAAAN